MPVCASSTTPAATVETNTPSATAPTPTPTGTVTAPSTEQAVSVTIQNYSFSPEVITVKKGALVTFTNRDNLEHTVTASGNEFGSGKIGTGKSFALDTSKLNPGSYVYHCSIHPTMTGTIVVE